MVTFFGASTSAASADNRELSHHVTWGANSVLFALIIWYMVENTVETKDARWGPVGLVTLGALLTMIDSTRHLLLDHDGVFFEPATIAMYSADGSLSEVGYFCMRTTQIGITCLLVGMLWYIKLPTKLLKLCGGSHCVEV